MPQSTHTTYPKLTLASKRGAVFASAFIATLSLSSWVHAQGLPPEAAADAPSEAPVAPNVTPPVASASPPSIAPASLARPSDDCPPQSSARLHEGFYLRIASGPSLVSLRGHGPSGSASLTDVGNSGFIAIGGAVAPGLVLAGTLQASVFNARFKGGPFDPAVSSSVDRLSLSNKADGGFGMIGVLLDWYPRPKAGFHAGVAAGFGAVALKNSADDSGLGGANLAGSVFGGYDWTLGRNWGLGLQLTANGGTSTKLKEDPDSRDSGYRLTPLTLGLQASLLYF